MSDSLAARRTAPRVQQVPGLPRRQEPQGPHPARRYLAARPQGRHRCGLASPLPRPDEQRTDRRTLASAEKAQLSSIVPPDAPCLFCPQEDLAADSLRASGTATPMSPSGDGGDATGLDEWDGGEEGIVDFSSFVNQVRAPSCVVADRSDGGTLTSCARNHSPQTPLTVSPKQPLEFVMQLFRRMGCVVPSIRSPSRAPSSLALGPSIVQPARHPRRALWPARRLVSVKDCLKYTIAHEADHEHDSLGSSGGDELEATLEELRLWGKDVKRWVVEKVTGREVPPSPEALRMGSTGFTTSEGDSSAEESYRSGSGGGLGDERVGRSRDRG